jgi:hypothetical protein
MILKSANFGNNAGKIRDISFFIPAQCKLNVLVFLILLNISPTVGLTGFVPFVLWN